MRRTKRRPSAWIGALLPAALLPGVWTGCQHLGLAHEHCAGQVARAGPFEPRRLHVRAELLHKGEARRYEAVLELGPDGAALVGLTPFGTRAFTVHPREGGLDVENRVGRYLGQSPRLLFDAVARAWLAPEAAAGTARALPGAQERVTSRGDERWFLPLDAEPDDADPHARARLAEGEAQVTNRWCGYEARLLVVSDDAAEKAE